VVIHSPTPNPRPPSTLVGRVRLANTAAAVLTLDNACCGSSTRWSAPGGGRQLGDAGRDPVLVGDQVAYDGVVLNCLAVSCRYRAWVNLPVPLAERTAR
jgi:hypothetical protein